MHCIKDVWNINRINKDNLNIFYGNFNGRDLVDLSSEFQSLGALTTKPFVPKYSLGLTSRAPSADQTGLEGTFSISKSEIYFWTRPFKDKKVNNNILKSILILTGSQCKEASTSGMYSHLLVM